METLIIIIVLFVFVAGILAAMFYLDRRRSDKIQAIATRLGFTFRRTSTDADWALIAGCHIGNAGPGRILRSAEFPARRRSATSALVTIAL